MFRFFGIAISGDAEAATRQQASKLVVEPVGTAPKFSKLLTDVLVSEGDKVVFECCVDGEPRPSITWLLNNQEITSTDGIQIAEDGKGNVSLTIVKAVPSHKGVYTVKASNICGEAKCFANLIVKSLSPPDIKRPEPQEEKVIPAFKELFADRTILESQSTKFECVVTGKPQPKVQWLLNDKPVAGKAYLQTTVGDKHVLTVQGAQMEHGGRYACVAENEAGKATCVAYLSVMEDYPKDIKPSALIDSSSRVSEKSSSYSMKKSTIVQSSSSQMTQSGGGEPKTQVHSFTAQADHLLQEVDHKPVLEVKSQKIDESHQVNQDKPVVHKHSLLTMTNGREETHDSLTSDSSTTPVASPKPVRKSVPPRFVTPLMGKIVDQGADVILSGIVDGFPTCDVSWTKNGQPLLQKEGSVIVSYKLNKTQLELKNVNVKDGGRYTCTATNPAGSASSTADVVVKKTVFPPVFGRRLQAQMVKTGDRVVMEVEATGTPDPTVTWYKDDKLILGAVPGQKFRTKIQGNNYSLIIEKASPEYSGKYMVKATNCCGEAQSIADFLVLEPDADHDILTHTVVQNVMHTSTQKHEKEEKVSVKVEQQEAVPPQVRPTKTETHKVPPPSPLATVAAPVTSESLHVEELLKSEKHLSIKMERTPSPGSLKPARAPPVTPQQVVTEVKTTAPKEIEIPITIEPSVPQKPAAEETARKEEPAVSLVTETKEEVEATGIDTESITKQSALDFFIGKMKDEDSKIPQTQDSVVDTGASTTVTDIKSQFETISTTEERGSKEVPPKPAKTDKEPVSRFIPKEPVYGSVVDKRHQASSSVKSEFRTESSSFESRTSQMFVQQSVSQSTEGFDLLPEPPPEICFTPKTEAPEKLKMDMPSRAKILEDTQRILSPVEIPSGAIRIFPSPAKPETPVVEKFESKTTELLKQKFQPPLLPERHVPIKKPEKTLIENEEVCKKQVVEEVQVEKKIHLPGSGDWSYRPTPHISVPPPPVVETKPWTPTVPATTPQPPTQAWKPVIPAATPQLPQTQVVPTPQTPKPVDKLPWSSTLDSQKQSYSSTTKTLISESSTSAFSSVQPPQIKRAASPRPSTEGVAMEKLWTPHKPSEPEAIIPRPTSTGPHRAASPKPSMEGIAMDKLWAHKHPDSALKKAWPPPQPVEEKPVVPWAAKGEQEKVWPPHDTTSTTTQIIKETEDISRQQRVVSTETIKQPQQDVKHYTAEAKYEQSSLLLSNQFPPTETINETVTQTQETTSKYSQELFSDFHSTHETSVTKESSPPVVEERVLKPSETKKFWPPGGKGEAEPRAPLIAKVAAPKREPPRKPATPFASVNGDIHLEPGPPPEMGYAPPPLERRQSYVETIEQDLERGLDKEPTKHLVGAVRTMPPPPQREKSLTPGPPTPQKERSLPPLLPPKERVLPPPQVHPVKPAPKVKTKPVVESKPFQPFPELEPFPFKPEPQRPKLSKCPPPPKPSKFMKGEFASSDYESDVDTVHIKSRWRPYESDTEDFAYKRVLPPTTTPQPKRPKSTEPEPPPPSKYDVPPQFDGPPRPKSDVFQTTRTDVTQQLTSKTEVKMEKVRMKKRHSPPPLKPGSPPLILQSVVSEEIPTSPVKTKPDSPKSKQKSFRTPQQDSGYMADTDEPRTLRTSHHKSTSTRHEESSRTSIEQTTVFSEKISSHQSSEQQQQRTVVQEVAPPVKTQSSFRAHHRHVEHKAEKKVSAPPVVAPAAVKPKKELVVKDVPVTYAQPPRDERASSLEPFPFKTEPVRPIAKRSLGPPPPSPSKFVKGEFRESDYESDYEGRIPALWRPIDSDVDDPTYRPVRPVLQTTQRRSQSSMELQSPVPPTEFDNPPQFGGPPRPKFEPIEKPVFVKCEKKPERPQFTVKPKPVAPKAAPLEVIVATPAVRKEPPITLKPESPPEIGFAPPPRATYTAHTKVSNFPNATQTETSKVMKFAESTEHSHRVMSVQQTTKVIKYGEKENEPPQLEPFPFKPEPAKPVRRYSGPPPTVPKKFVPGEFRESDYESDYETMRIKPKWIPGGSDSEEPQYRKVKVPSLSRSSSTPTKPSVKVPTPMEFESEPRLLQTDLAKPKPVVVEQDAEQKRLRRVEEMRKRFSETTTHSKSSQQQATDIIIEPGEPPEFGFMGGHIPTATSYAATKHINEMTSTFKSKAKQFVDDIISDVQSSKQVTKPEKPILKPVLPKEVPQAQTADEPQVYREETRVAEHGTKHIDPDTGLIYFKYDFGYEFGIVLPGEGKAKDDDKSAKRPRIETKQSEDAVDFPVIHERTGDKTRPKTGDATAGGGDKAPLFRPKKFTHSKGVKWEPMSESEMSEAEGDGGAHKKRYSLPQPPHISIPGASRWDQSTPSPVSLSPSLPSLSPRYPGTAPGQDSAVSPGGSWQAANSTPTKVAGRGRAGTPTPPSTPSTPGSVGGQLHKPPSFITPLRDIAVVSAQTARFECIVQAEPQPNILWSKNGRIIENSEDYQIHYRNGVCRLTIPRAYPEDAGNYTCTATNMFGTIGTSASLQVPGERRSLLRKP